MFYQHFPASNNFTLLKSVFFTAESAEVTNAIVKSSSVLQEADVKGSNKYGCEEGEIQKSIGVYKLHDDMMI